MLTAPWFGTKARASSRIEEPQMIIIWLSVCMYQLIQAIEAGGDVGVEALLRMLDSSLV